MFREDDYLNSEEPFASIETSNMGCKWAGFLYERRDGGFDLFYDHDNSEFKTVEVAKVTLLRHRFMAENGAVLVAHLGKEKVRKILLDRAKRHLLDWITTIIGN